MLLPSTDQAVLGYLGRALSLELSAVQMYSTQARLVDTWGLSEVAKRLSNEASEEMTHAERIISRMLALGVAPNASQLRPVNLATDLYSLLLNDYEFENEIISLYQSASQYCARNGDNENRLFFDELLNEEKQHAQGLLQWLNDIQQP